MLRRVIQRISQTIRSKKIRMAETVSSIVGGDRAIKAEGTTSMKRSHEEGDDGAVKKIKAEQVTFILMNFQFLYICLVCTANKGIHLCNYFKTYIISIFGVQVYFCQTCKTYTLCMIMSPKSCNYKCNFIT